MSRAAGTRLGPYELLGLIGAGGEVEVCCAEDTRLDREAHTISGLNHPHICTLHAVGEANGVTFLVTEHLHGESLAECPTKGPTPLAPTLDIAMHTAHALDAAHTHGITVAPSSLAARGRR